MSITGFFYPFLTSIADSIIRVSPIIGLMGAPKGWTLNVDEVRLYTGARFIVPICGRMFLMPGLPPIPAANKMDHTEDGNIIGLN